MLYGYVRNCTELYGAGGGDAAAIVIDMRSLGYMYKFSLANLKKSEFYGLFASVLIRTFPYCCWLAIESVMLRQAKCSCKSNACFARYVVRNCTELYGIVRNCTEPAAGTPPLLL